MHVTSGHAARLEGLPSDLSQQYLLAVEDIFQGLRRSITTVSAMVLLLQVGKQADDLPLEIGLTSTVNEVKMFLENALALDRRFSSLPSHLSLVASCLLVQDACRGLRMALRRDPQVKAEKIPPVLMSIQRAYNSLRTFSSATPWDPTTINSSCACVSN